jgi:probable rRNA maturation factor
MTMASSENFRISVSGEESLGTTDRALLVKAVKAALRAHSICRAKIGLRLVSDEEIALMNEKHLGHEGPTDVLTFDLHDGNSEAGVEGEIALSIDTARREADHHVHSIEAELALYAVHGVLHLLNYQDDTPLAANRMHATEDQILESLGLGAVFASSRR